MRKPNISKPARPQMEVYTSSQASGWVYSALPSPLTSLYCLVMTGSITGLAYFAGEKWGGDGGGTLWSTIAIGVMTTLGLIIMGFRAKRAKAEASEQGDFTSALRGSASGWDGSVSDPAEIARLDDLRSNFFKGIQTFQEYGKDIYSLPWYVIVGEPGSGKSEAIRRSELRFPDTLQDKLQGTGGTYSMHWWFTNQAIILDTAGAMLMQPEAASRFEEFLKLLSTNRPACPINGMILTIPTDSLLSDPPAVAEQKARTIATQLAAIQKALDVRFPIYLMVSKSDRLPGFREFFDMEGQAKFERQMMGWANPAPLGEPFNSETVYEAIDTISRRLQSRSLALLADPIPPDNSARRVDEVDSVYAFPNFIRGLAPRLKLYLDVIFQTGTWATKPPFFRGIFFTTALREGAQLDLDLAKTLGMPLSQLPPGGIFTREKSSFIRDLFLEKIFPEQGLVTRLFDVGAHLRKRLTTFYGVTALLLLFALSFAWLVKSHLETQLERDQEMWGTANGTWRNGTFLPIVSRGSSYSQDIPDRPKWTLNDKDKPVETLQTIREKVYRDISLSWVFYPVPEWRDFLDRRELGYLTLFEGSVMKPILDGVRERIRWDVATGNTTSAEAKKRLAAAYYRLLELEVWLAEENSKPTEEAWKAWFTDLITYLSDPAVPGGIPYDYPTNKPHPVTAKLPLISTLVSDMAELAFDAYGNHVQLSKRRWMSELDDAREADHLRSISEGSRLLLGISGEVEQSQEMDAENLENLKSAAQAFLTTENELNRIQAENDDEPLARIRELLSNLTAHASHIAAVKTPGGSATDLTQFKEFLQKIQPLAQKLNGQDNFFDSLSRQISDLLSGKTKQNNLQLSPDLAEKVMKDNCYKTRLDLYLKALSNNTQQLSTAQQLTRGNHIGRLSALMTVASPLTTATAAPAPPKEPAYKGPRDDVFRSIHDELLHSYKDASIIEQQLGGYMREVVSQLPEILRFPLVREMDRPFAPQDPSLISVCKNLTKISKDIEAFYERQNDLKASETLAKLKQMFTAIEPVIAVSKSLYDEQLQSLRKIKVNPSKPRKFELEQPLSPPPPPVAIPGQPAPFTPTPEPVSIPGFKALVIQTSDGEYIVQDTANVAPSEVPCHVGIKGHYVFAQKAVDTRPESFSEYGGEWGIVKALIKGGRVYRPADGRLSISLDCTPPPPSKWPSASDFQIFLPANR
jgi:hypothetical protein